MKKLKWLTLMILSLCFLALIVITLIYNPVENETQVLPEDSHQEETEPEEAKEPDEDEAASEEEDATEEEEQASVGEGIREAFSSVIENARNLFLRDDLKIVAIGDSLTQGVGDRTENGGYVGILEDNFNQSNETTNFTIDNFGRRGDRTDQLLERMESRDMTSSIKDADIVLITIGANNVMQVIEHNFTSLSYDDFPPARANYAVELEEIFSTIEEANPNASIYLVGLYNPFNQYFDHIPALAQIMNEWNRESESIIDDRENVTFIPIKDIFEGNEKELLWEVDHFHPNEEGYKQMAKRVLEYIRDDIEEIEE
ncbi:SGNH/GDSL hydrolase family protein [Halobacillus sp. Marseille-Q1614]|uniref:SGNH/GDSL hydrolase family protein n=1 Tax=Halobacillus sp. Marseille-Q1614 TaxID=2709134 RepID=UPI00156F0544|nr:SGNH/GDSL hydrolase family protein [Halobacillus sp. Marseille-Q1614]